MAATAISSFHNPMDQSFASRDELISARKLDTVPLPSGKCIHVRELGGVELLEYKELTESLKEKKIDGLEGGLEVLALLASMSVCTPDGALIFSRDDIPVIKGMSVELLKAISEKTMEISGQNLTNSLKKSLTDSESSSTTSPTSLEGSPSEDSAPS